MEKSRTQKRGFSKLMINIEKTWMEKLTSWTTDIGYYYKKKNNGYLFLQSLLSISNI
jgi:hypothetical protein